MEENNKNLPEEMAEETTPVEETGTPQAEETTPVEDVSTPQNEEAESEPSPEIEEDIKAEDIPQAEEPPAVKETMPNPPQRFEYTPVNHNEEKQNNKGLKVFCIVLALIVLLAGSCSIGYLFGRTTVIKSGKTHTEVELAARPQSGDEMTEAEVYEKLNESIVGIRVYGSGEEFSDCSGVVYSDDGYIVSNDHIYSEIVGAKFKVYTYDGKEYDAKYVAGDQISDLTILKVENANLKAATFGDSDEIFCGEHVVAIGRPSDAKANSSITSGIISLPKRRVKTTTNYTSNLIQTDSAINPGSSGGALVDMYGHVVGITSSKLSGTVYDSVCFAIPSRTVKRVCEELIKNGKVVSRAKLGITYQEIDSVAAEIKGNNVTGLYIASVSSESDLYGKVTEGDIITHINGEKITADTVVLDIIEASSAGDTVTITVSKTNGSTAEYTVKLLANEGTSSYKTEEEQIKENEDNTEETPDNSGDKAFNFPFGE